jgi:hypothetical protein
MSFFDEDVDTRRRTSARPRRSAPSRGASSDHQAVLIRRVVALGGGLLLLLLLALGINSCRSNAKENGLKDYNRAAASIARDSETQVGRPFFGLFSGDAANSPTDLQTSVASLRVEAEKQLKRAEDLSVPDEMVPAHRSLLIALEFRRDGLDAIGQKVRTAVGDQGDASTEAATSIAGQMQSFLASDVIYRARVQPLIKEVLDGEEIGGQDIPGSRFLPNLSWLDPQTVSDRLGGGGGSSDDTGSNATPAPGTHGTGIVSVGVGETTLQPGTPNRIPLSGPPTFAVRFANQGENDERNIRVVVRVTRSGAQPIQGTDTVSTVARGATGEATVRLPRAPATGAASTVTVQVRPVPGEKVTDNNEQEYQALFE